LLLSLETATRAGSIAITRGASIIASSSGVAEESHSISLLQHIESMLKEAHLTFDEINVFATASGPGSFTGIRIGIATAKAFAHTLKRPCVGVPTLEAVAHAAGASAQTYVLLPAGRGEVFAQLFSVDEGGTVAPLNAAEHVAPQHLLDRIAQADSIRWAGAGAHLYANAIKEHAGMLGIKFIDEQEGAFDESNANQRWTLAPVNDLLAENIAVLALQKLRGQDEGMHKPENLQAIYVRPSDAELSK
jgi:tRNA threonylcarbamoyladenosine biosynthesis protein TsaB